MSDEDSIDLPQRCSYETVRQKIQAFIDFVPSTPESLGPDSSQDLDELPFLPFHEHHLAEELSLKAVRVLPTLRDDIIGVFDQAIATLDNKQPHMATPGLRAHFPPRPNEERPNNDAKSIIDIYVDATGRYAPVLASMLLLHPEAPLWSTAVEWKNREAPYSTISNVFNEDFLTVFCTDDPDFMHPETWNTLEPEVTKLLSDAAAQNPTLCIWHAFSASPEVERLLEEVEELSSKGAFPTIQPGTKGLPKPNPQFNPGCDASKTPWGITMSEFISHPPVERAENSRSTPRLARRSARLRDRTSKKPKAEELKPQKRRPRAKITEEKKVIIPQPPEQGSMARATSASIIQHAWYRAVEEDTTFLVLHSGSTERIGFRHRGTNTLYLTEKITINECGQSVYGKLHIGLYMCILKDALDRQKQVNGGNASRGRSTRKKGNGKWQVSTRHRAPIKFSFRPYYRTRGFTARQDQRKRRFRTIATLAGERPLALLWFQEGLLQSPSPSSFVRTEELSREGEELGPSDYMTITLVSGISTGATGDAHKALLSLIQPQKLECGVVVKLGYEPGQRARMRHEAEIYRHLNASGVSGIPFFFGLFQDVETRTLALVMEDAGESIASLIHRGARARKQFSAQERDGFLQILQSIHDAGIRHRDIRPVNLTINEVGDPVIIDFDRALQGAGNTSRDRELEHLRGMLYGEHEDEPGELRTLSAQETPSFTWSE